MTTGNVKQTQENCDIRVWSGACFHRDTTDPGDKYLCSTCEKISKLDHEMKHDNFPYMSGDTDNLS